MGALGSGVSSLSGLVCLIFMFKGIGLSPPVAMTGMMVMASIQAIEIRNSFLITIQFKLLQSYEKVR